MRLSVFASGSGGNCMLLSDRQSNLLIDAGISMRRIQAGLRCARLAWQDIGGVLITHEHSDHISALDMLCKHVQLPVYAPHTVANRLRGKYPGVESCLRIIPVGEPFPIGSLSVLAFHTPHDCDESVGYRIEGSAVFAMATDMGAVTDEIRSGLLGADTVLIEANHDLTMLRDGPYPYPLKRRILSDHGHLSNTACAALARELAERGCSRIVLGHLSRENNTPSLALEAVGAALAGLPVELCCAPVSGFLCVDVGQEAPCCTSS